MSKSPKERTGPAQVREEQPFIPQRFQHAAAIGFLVLSLVVFFYPVIFGGKTFLGVDTIASHSFETLIEDAKIEGVFPLWNPYIFCGMPAYASLTLGGSRPFDLSASILAIAVTAFHYLMLASPVGWVLFYYVVFAAGVYVFAFSKVHDKIAALVAALAAMFSMYIIIWVMVGHNTKPAVMAMFPWILYVMEKLREKFDLTLMLALVVLLHFAFLPSHVQMIFYVYLALGIYLLFFFVRNFVKKEDWKGVVRAGAILAVASIIAFAMDSDKYLSVLEYNPYSIRGSAPIVPSVQKGEVKTQAGGLDYDYATSWSLAPGEMMTFFIPSWYGFGWHTYQGSLTGNQPLRVNTYWGPQPFTDGPQYMGVVVLILAIIGFLRNRKDPFVQYLAITIGFSLLVAFGKEFPLVYDLMYRYFPMFNKFRIPSMILVLVQIFVPLLAAYGIASLIAGAARTFTMQEERKWKYRLYPLGAILILTFVARGVFESMYISFFPLPDVRGHIIRAIRSDQAVVIKEFYDLVVNAVVVDFSVALLFLIATFGGLLLYWKHQMKLTTLSAVLVIVVLADLWRVDIKPMDAKNRQEQKDIFTAPDYVQFLQRDKSLYRTLTFVDGQPPYDNTLAYWRIQSAYGYQGAKMRAYQDMIEVAGLGNPLVWQLMNVKYVISNTRDSSQMMEMAYEGKEFKVYRNRDAVPRAFFVNRYEVANGLEILNKIGSLSFNPTDVAYCTEDPKLSIEPPRDGSSAEFVRYGIQGFELRVTATGNNLLFLSETYYPQGWNAYIDGAETNMYRLNYLFRGVMVPPGTHKLEMKFEPRGFYLGRNISLATNILVLGAFSFFGLDFWRKKRKGGESGGGRG